jgi:hypothetical protein
LDYTRQRSSQSPGIYWQGLCDDNGISPTPNEIRKIVEAVERYCEHDPNDSDACSLAFGVDTFQYTKLDKKKIPIKVIVITSRETQRKLESVQITTQARTRRSR